MQEYQWDDKSISLEILLQTEKQTTSNTLNVRGEDSVEINNLINIFFRLSYHCWEDMQLDSDEHWFISRANLIYIRLPYSLRTIYNLWLKGYYLEAMVVFRQILEGLATLRYFHKYPHKIKKHLKATRHKERVYFSTMFKEFSPGFYSNWYGDTFSDLAHGGLFADSFRLKGSFAQGEIVMGCEFNLEKSDLVTVTTILISYGYLNYISTFFPSITSKISSTIKNRIQDVSEHIENKYLKKSDNDFVKVILPLICK